MIMVDLHYRFLALSCRLDQFVDDDVFLSLPPHQQDLAVQSNSRKTISPQIAACNRDVLQAINTCRPTISIRSMKYSRHFFFFAIDQKKKKNVAQPLPPFLF
jgi:hypothetical protein